MAWRRPSVRARLAPLLRGCAALIELATRKGAREPASRPAQRRLCDAEPSVLGTGLSKGRLGSGSLI